MQNISHLIRALFLHLEHGIYEWKNGPEEEKNEIPKHASDDSSSCDGFHRQSSSTFLARCDMINTESSHEMAAYVAAEVKDGFRESLPESSLKNYSNSCIAPFQLNEIKLGRLLGSGEFSHVYEIKSFHLDVSVDVSGNYEEIEIRQYMKGREKYRDTKKATYALKHLRPELLEKYQSNEYAQYASDLVQEAEFLSVLQHPNIIKLRGISLLGSSGFVHGPKGYFLIVDRLDETLADRIAKWKRTSKKLSEKVSFDFLQSSMGRTTKNNDNIGDDAALLLSQKLEIVLQLAAAIVYLHDKKIIFRDLKPDNIGFDVRGDVKLFDFGLAKVMPPDGDPHNDFYKMSSTGTPRYMAPEVLEVKRGYNLKADVYSFVMVLWEILSSEKPFVFINNRHALIRHVLRDEGRPNIKNEWPSSIKDIMNTSFDRSPKERPTMTFFLEVIRSALCELRNGDDSKLKDAFLLRRRSVMSAEEEPPKRNHSKMGETMWAAFFPSKPKLRHSATSETPQTHLVSNRPKFTRSATTTY